MSQKNSQKHETSLQQITDQNFPHVLNQKLIVRPNEVKLKLTVEIISQRLC